MRSTNTFATNRYHKLVTLIGRKLVGVSGGFLGFGIVLIIAVNNSEFRSSLIHLLMRDTILAPNWLVANSYYIQSTSKPKDPVAAL